MKFCSRCKTNKPFSDFTKNKSSKDGIGYFCKACRIARGKIDRVKYKTQFKKSEQERYKQQHVKDGYKRRAIQWQKDNPSMFVPYNRAKAAYKRVSILYPDAKRQSIKDTLPAYTLAFQLEQQTGIKHEVDHRRPLQGGGDHALSNLEVITTHQHKLKCKQEHEIVRQLLTLYYDKPEYFNEIQ